MVMMVARCGLGFFRALMSRQPMPLLSRACNELPVQRVHNILALVITCNISGLFPKAYQTIVQLFERSTLCEEE